MGVNSLSLSLSPAIIGVESTSRGSGFPEGKIIARVHDMFVLQKYFF